MLDGQVSSTPSDQEISDNVIASALLTCGLVMEGKSFKMFVCLEGGCMKLRGKAFEGGWMKLRGLKVAA